MNLPGRGRGNESLDLTPKERGDQLAFTISSPHLERVPLHTAARDPVREGSWTTSSAGTRLCGRLTEFPALSQTHLQASLPASAAASGRTLSECYSLKVHLCLLCGRFSDVSVFGSLQFRCAVSSDRFLFVNVW